MTTPEEHLQRLKRRETARYSTRAERLSDWFFSLGDKVRVYRRQFERRLERDKSFRQKYLWGRRFASMMGSYRGAGNDGAKFGTSTGSADAESRGDHRTMAHRARQLERDDPLASGLLHTIISNTIGTGIWPQATVTRLDPTGEPVSDNAINRTLEETFRKRAHNLDAVHGCSFEQFQALVLRAYIRDGDVFVLPVVYEKGSPVQFEIIEKDRVSTPADVKPRDEGGRIVEGIERDHQGRIVAYWIRREHPGDSFMFPLPTKDGFTRVEASRVLRLYAPDRPGASVGVSSFHAVLQDFRDLDLLTVASLKRIQVAACLAVFFETESSPTDFLDGLEGDDDLPTTSAGRLQGNLEPGMMLRLDPGEKVSSVSPNFPTPELYPFVKMIAMRIGAAFGISWEEVLRNWSEDSYSSARSTALESRKTYRSLQILFARRILKGMWTAVLTDAVLSDSGRFDGISKEDFDSIRWQFPGWEWVDPLREMKAEALALSTGLTTWQHSLAKRGIDWEDHFKQLQREKQKILDLGLDEILKVVYGAGVEATIANAWAQDGMTAENEE